jgi:hypothetical protein
MSTGVTGKVTGGVTADDWDRLRLDRVTVGTAQAKSDM